MVMVAMVGQALLALVGGALAAAAVAWVAWRLFAWTHHPAWAPAVTFGGLAIILHASDFTTMFLLFGTLLSIAALMGIPVEETARPEQQRRQGSHLRTGRQR